MTQFPHIARTNHELLIPQEIACNIDARFVQVTYMFLSSHRAVVCITNGQAGRKERSSLTALAAASRVNSDIEPPATVLFDAGLESGPYTCGDTAENICKAISKRFGLSMFVQYCVNGLPQILDFGPATSGNTPEHKKRMKLLLSTVLTKVIMSDLRTHFQSVIM